VIDKEVATAEAAVAGIGDGATVLISGFGPPGQPDWLIDALTNLGLTGLTVVNNNANAGSEAITRFFESGAVAKVVCSFPKALNGRGFEPLYRAGKIELELVPQGTLAERIRAGGAGIPAFYTRTALGTELAQGKETREFDGVSYVMERAITGDLAVLRAAKADRAGNLVYAKTGRNFGPIMAAAARVSAVEVVELVDTGAIDPEHIVTPGIYVDRIFTSGEQRTRE